MAKHITLNDRARRERYIGCKPNQLGSLHERMKLVMALATDMDLWRYDKSGGQRLWQALHDLETEVAYHAPAIPPYGRRGVKV